tara:strand:+ start:2453 stop:2935 length:483 start_codon:yes stop_codon:yes gene_type:complete
MNILLIGACGSGKTWVMKQIIQAYNLKTPAKIGMIKFVTDKRLSVLGVYDGSVFEGSDKLSMAVMRDCESWEKVRQKHNMIGVCEGDRFTNKTFIETCKPYIIKIIDDGSDGRELRQSSQSERHLKAIQTRVGNIKADEEVKDSQQALTIIQGMICKLLI